MNNNKKVFILEITSCINGQHAADVEVFDSYSKAKWRMDEMFDIDAESDLAQVMDTIKRGDYVCEMYDETDIDNEHIVYEIYEREIQ